MRLIYWSHGVEKNIKNRLINRSENTEEIVTITSYNYILNYY